MLNLKRLNNDTFFPTLLEDFFPAERNRRAEFAWPAMDATELADKYVVRLEVPGVSEKDINITYDDGVLKVSGQTLQERESGDEKYYVQERYQGSFSRSLRLNRKIDVSKILASMKNGVLRIEIPKSEINQTKQIPIQTNAIEG